MPYNSFFKAEVTIFIVALGPFIFSVIINVTGLKSTSLLFSFFSTCIFCSPLLVFFNILIYYYYYWSVISYTSFEREKGGGRFSTAVWVCGSNLHHPLVYLLSVAVFMPQQQDWVAVTRTYSLQSLKELSSKSFICLTTDL